MKTREGKLPANYPEWVSGVTPDTHEHATVTRSRTVSGVPGIRVRGATYRGCRPIDGVFELVALNPQRVAGEERYEVYCAWFGVKPLTTYPRISISPGHYEILPDYSGEVIDNLSA